MFSVALNKANIEKQFRNSDIYIQHGPHGLGRRERFTCCSVTPPSPLPSPFHPTNPYLQRHLLLHRPRAAPPRHNFPMDPSAILPHDGVRAVRRLLAVLWHVAAAHIGLSS